MLQEADAGGQKEDSTYLLDCERQHFGIDHCEAGLWLSNEWNLPEELGVIASRHHDRSYGKSAKMLTIAAISCRLADALGFDVVRTTQPFTLEMALDSLPAETRKRFPVDEETLKGQIEKKISEFESPGGPTVQSPAAPAARVTRPSIRRTTSGRKNSCSPKTPRHSRPRSHRPATVFCSPSSLELFS